MKKFTLSAFCLFLMVQLSNAQELWFDAGLKIAYGSSALLNGNILDDDSYSYDLASNLAFGGKFGINYGPNNGFTIDALVGKYKGSIEFTPDNINGVYEWKTLDLYTMYRRNGNLAYFEVGPKMSLVNEMTLTDPMTPGELERSDEVKNYFSAVLGFGWYVMGNEGRFSGILGFRVEYGFTDMTSDLGKENGYPVPDIQPPITNDYAKTNPVVASIVFELNWGVGKFAANNCGARRKFIWF
jgi:hypothetical protein